MKCLNREFVKIIFVITARDEIVVTKCTKGDKRDFIDEY